MVLILWNISNVSFEEKPQSFTSADTGMTEVNTTDIMLELYSILLMVINALLLGDRQCQLPVSVVPLCGCAWSLLGEERGTRRVHVCSLPHHPSTEAGGDTERR